MPRCFFNFEDFCIDRSQSLVKYVSFIMTFILEGKYNRTVQPKYAKQTRQLICIEKNRRNLFSDVCDAVIRAIATFIHMANRR